MRRINRYIGSAVSMSIFSVLLVLVSLDAIAELVEQLDELKGQYGFSQALMYVGLKLPGSLYEMLPFSALVGCLIGLGSLAATSELVIIRAAGVSVAKIAVSVMRPAVVFIALGLLLGEYVTPITDQVAESQRAIAQGGRGALESRHGLWNKEGREFMHFNAVESNGKLHGVTRYQFSEDGSLISSSFAETAVFQSGQWQEELGQFSVFFDDRVETEAFSFRKWDTSLTPGLLKVLSLEPHELSMRDLYTYSQYLKEQSLDDQDYELAFWSKVLQPFATASLVFIAISFIFGPLRQVTAGFRVFTGIIVGVVFQLSQDLLSPASLVFGFEPMLAVAAPILTCFVVGLFLIQKAR